MAEQWYYSQEGQQRGPLTPSQIKELVAAGKLKPTDLIWKEGLESWIPASRLKGLFPQETLAESTEESQLAVNTGASTMTARRESDHPAAVAWRLLGSSLGVCCKRLPAVVFVTVIWYVASLFALSLIVTAPLAIAFALGYVTIISQIIRREPFSLKDFVSFFRYGWNALFYLIVLLACAFVILSVAALAILAGIWLFGTIATVIKSPILVIVLSVVFGLGLSTLYFAFIILLFCLFVRVTTSSPSEDRPFDFIYDAFGNTMAILSKRWRTLGCAGFWLALFYIGALLLYMTGIEYLLPKLIDVSEPGMIDLMNADDTSASPRRTYLFLSQIIAVLSGLYYLLLGTLSNVFFVSTANYLVGKTDPQNDAEMTRE